MKIRKYLIPFLIIALIIAGVYAQNTSFSNPANKACDIENLKADNVQPFKHQKVTFDFQGNCPECKAVWTATGGGTPSTGILSGGDGRFSVTWTTPGKKIVTVTCGNDKPLTQEINVRDKCQTGIVDIGLPYTEQDKNKTRWNFNFPLNDGVNPSRMYTKRCLNGAKVTYWYESFRRVKDKEIMQYTYQKQGFRDEKCEITLMKPKRINAEWVDAGEPTQWHRGPIKRHKAEKSQVCPKPPGGGGGGGDEGEEENDDHDCEEPAEANTGEVDFSGDEEKFICVDEDQEEYKLDFIYRIVAHNTPRSRTLFGKLKLELVEGDDVAEILYNGNPYTFGTNIDVNEPGHSGCGHHFNHGGQIGFTFKPKLDANGNPKEGTIKVKGICDPDPEAPEDGGDGVPTVTPTLTLHFVKFNALIDSDNDGTIEEDEDEEVEEDSPGKIIACNSSDSDSDRIPDFADGYSFNDEEGSDNINSDSKFTQINIKVPKSLIDSGKFSRDDLMLKFQYSSSNPKSDISVEEVKIPTGFEKRYFIFGGGNYRIWTKDANETRNANDVAEEGDFIKSNEPYKLSWLPPIAESGNIRFYIEAIKPSITTGFDSISVSLIESEDNTVICTDEVKLTSVNPKVLPDWNRDGIFNFHDDYKVNAEDPWVTWINDDSDKDSLAFGDAKAEPDVDFPKESSAEKDTSDNISNGIRDLLDFFPIRLEILNTLRLLPPDKYEYYLSSEGIKFMPTTLKSHDTDAYLQSNTANEYSTNTLFTLGNLKLENNYLNSILSGENSGIILIEGNQLTPDGENSNLKLTIKKIGNSEELVTIEMPLKVVKVMDLIKHVNYRILTGKSDGYPLQTIEKTRPYCMNSEDTLFWVHGYNVEGDAAISTFAEVFKRLFHSGFNGHFYGVSWDGTPQPNLLNIGPPHYHQNVVNSFATAPEYKKLVNQVKSSGKGKVFLLGHSMGNMLNNWAIQNGANFDKYFAIDAAVAVETHLVSMPIETQHIDIEMFDYSDLLNGVRDWKDYWNYVNNNDNTHPARRLLASEWYRLFPETDERNKLTWRGIFKDVPSDKVYNFYSSTEEVLRKSSTSSVVWDDPLLDNENNGGFAYYTWVKQEKLKGLNDYTAGNFATIGGAVSPFFGWGYNQDYESGLFGTMEPEDTLQITDDQLKTNPFFSIFRLRPITLGNSNLLESDIGFDIRRMLIDIGGQTPSDYLKTNLNLTNLKDYYTRNSDIHTRVTVKDFLLAEALPATTNALGQERDPSLSELPFNNINMSTQLKNTTMEWPREEFKAGEGKEWHHSDIKDLSYQYVYRFYDKLVKLMTEEEE